MKTNIITKSIVCLAVAGTVAACGNQKKVKDSAAEQAMADSLKQAEMIQKQKDAESLAAGLPDEPVFDIVTSLGTIKVKLLQQNPEASCEFRETRDFRLL